MPSAHDSEAPLPLHESTAHSDSAHHSHGAEPSVRDFFISFKTMDFRLRALSGLAFAEVVAGVIAIATKRDLFPSVTLRFLTFDITVSWPTFILAGIFVIFGLYLLTRGTFEATPKGRLLFVGVLLSFFFAVIYGFFDLPLRSGLTAFLLTTVGYCAVAGALPRAYQKRYSPERQKKWFIGSLIILFVAPQLFILFGAPGIFSVYLALLRMPLIYLFLLAGTDWAEILDAGSLSLANFALRKAAVPILAVAVALSGVAIAAWTTLSSHWLAWAHLPIIGCLAVVAVLAFARFDGSWHPHFSWTGLLLVVTSVGIAINIAGFRYHALPTALPAIFAAVLAIFLILLARAKKLPHAWSALLFGIILGVLWVAWANSPTEQASSRVPNSILTVALIGILVLIVLLSMRRKGRNIVQPLLCTLSLNIAVAALYALGTVVYAGARAKSEEKELIEAAVVFIAIMWDIFVSGHSITNVDGKLFPRSSRISLFFGYISLVVATVLFWSSVTAEATATEAAIRSMGDAELIVQTGIVSLGPATILTLYIIRLGKWYFGSADSATHHNLAKT